MAESSLPWKPWHFKFMRSYSDKLLENITSSQDASARTLNAAVVLNVTSRERQFEFEAALDNEGLVVCLLMLRYRQSMNTDLRCFQKRETIESREETLKAQSRL
jgi:hypothetical protein